MASNQSGYFALAKRAASGWANDSCSRLSAALAYYTMVSIAPLLIVTFKLLSVFLKSGKARDLVNTQIGGLTSPDAAKMISAILDNAKNSSGGVLATTIGVAILVAGAMGVFGELQSAMNIIFKAPPVQHATIWDWLKHRLLSVSMVFGIGFLLLVSLFISAILSGMAHALGGKTVAVGVAIEAVVSLIVITLLFAGIFKFLPDRHTRWRPTLLAAVTTAILFTIGKWLLTIYLKFGSTASAYGAAGSLAALLIWVYYSAQILYYGAEVAYAASEFPEPAAEKPAPRQPSAEREVLRRPPARAAARSWTETVAAGVAGFAAGAGAWGLVRRAREGREQYDMNRRIDAVAQRVKQIDEFRLAARRFNVDERVRRIEEQVRRAADRSRP